MDFNFIGTDSFDRPVYKDETGRLWKDVDPRPTQKANLHSCDAFDGEPDFPIKSFEKYSDVKVEFKPQRITW